MRQSRLDLSGFRPPRDGDDIEVSLMTDETPLVFHGLAKDDNDDDPYTSWYAMEAASGATINFVTGTGTEGQPILLTGTVIKNGTVYQIRDVGNDEILVTQSQFSPEEVDNDAFETDGLEPDVDPDSIDHVDFPLVPGNRGLRGTSEDNYYDAKSDHRRLDSPDVLDVMVSAKRGQIAKDKHPHENIKTTHEFNSPFLSAGHLHERCSLRRCRSWLRRHLQCKLNHEKND